MGTSRAGACLGQSALKGALDEQARCQCSAALVGQTHPRDSLELLEVLVACLPLISIQLGSLRPCLCNLSPYLDF